ncbi:NAD(P)H-dependent oxidoreductase [Loktanella sp. IMCC34160]|uniref:NADPH-dependent FMN reductase n=1 Tax=Loktanella sp. IMCC34160 TaxID=2510646 RepID=UPI00101E0614|nr:NADPH-dependent FMN reductase [Loktanella sp. IMCC34160]RYG91177.1 NAD(P)H-dependent oxidoreductase [Loktanella sp. IMCC34160]
MGYLLGICGSLRAGSLNRKLMLEAARAYGAEEFIAGDIRFPLYDGDLQDSDGIPTEVQRLADQIAGAEAVIVVTPEYNKSLSGVLKNALDWVSRTDGSPWKDKPVAILSATAGRSGGERAQNSLRLALSPFAPRLLAGREVLVGQAKDQFDAEGRLTSDRYRAAVDTQMQALRDLAGA